MGKAAAAAVHPEKITRGEVKFSYPEGFKRRFFVRER
jgi:hypothetical protein